MHHVTWDEVIARARVARFGDLEVVKPDGSIQRGPVTGIRRGGSNVILNGNVILIGMIWMARRESRHEPWENLHSTGFMVSDECQPNFDRDGALCFGNSAIGQFRIFQKHAGPLEPHEVSGLEADQVRQSRAWMYDIPLDSSWRTIIERVLELAADGLVAVEDQIRVQDEAVQFA